VCRSREASTTRRLAVLAYLHKELKVMYEKCGAPAHKEEVDDGSVGRQLVAALMWTGVPLALYESGRGRHARGGTHQ
jgi:hypothetical protein